MKNLIYSLATICVIVFISSCKPCPDCPTNPGINPYAQEEDKTLNTKDTISLQTFQTWVDNWKNYGKKYTDTVLTTSFVMPLIDLSEFLENKGDKGRDSVVAARFYLGLRRDTIPNMPHLMLVGINAEGDSLTNADDGQYIYDVTLPCPTLCDSIPVN